MIDYIKLNATDDEIRFKIEEHAAMFDQLPCTVIIHDLQNQSVVYMSGNGLKQLGTTMDEIASISLDEYHSRYFNQDDARDYVPRILGMLERDSDDELVAFFQQVRFADNGEWKWHMTSIKVFHRDEYGRPSHTIAMAVPIDAMQHMAGKATRLLEENDFLRKNYEHFARLSNREKEILRLTVMGKSSVEIAEKLFISAATAETHRRNIKAKLNVSSYFELSQYARAFDLI